MLPPGIKVTTIITQMTVSKPPSTIFLVGEGVCRNRIIFYEAPDC